MDKKEFAWVFFLFVLFVLSLNFNSAVCGNDVWESEDEELGCDFEFMPCPDSFDGGIYEYWTGEDCRIKKITFDSGESYEYDFNGNLIFEDYVNSENDLIYRYWENGDLKEIIKDGISTYFVYDSLPDGSVIVSDEITRDKEGNINVKHYEYYDSGLIKSIDYLDEKVEYEYNSYGNIVKEAYTYYSPSDSSYSYTEWIAYDYDSNQNLVKMYDDRGYNIDMIYEEVSYDCEKSVCANNVCEEDGYCFDFTDCVDESCQTYSCSELDYVADSCSYFRLKNRVIGNEILELKYDEDGSEYGWCEYTDSVNCYNYTEEYNSEGFLTKDDYYSYSYLDNSSFVRESNYYDDNKVTYNFDDFDYNLDSAVTQMGEEVLKEDYLFSPTGELFAFESIPYDSGSSGGIFSLVAPIAKNLLTGFSILGEGFSQRYYVTGSSDISEGGYYSSSNLNNLLNNYLNRTGLTLPSDNYFDVLGICLELNDSVEFNGVSYYDFCFDNSTFKDYYCGIDLFKNDFWNIAKEVQKQREINCQFGCGNGSCIVDVLVPVINYSSDLPPEPEKPRGEM